jgi:hypothetical protein
VRDRVRRTDVEVRQAGGRHTAHRGTRLDAGLRHHHEGLRLQSVTYDQAVPAYRYGYALGAAERFRAGDWVAIEADARRR